MRFLIASKFIDPLKSSNICKNASVNKAIAISDNGLLPVQYRSNVSICTTEEIQCQVIIWGNAGAFKIQWNLKQKTKISRPENYFEIGVCKMAAILVRSEFIEVRNEKSIGVLL